MPQLVVLLLLLLPLLLLLLLLLLPFAPLLRLHFLWRRLRLSLRLTAAPPPEGR
jgi:hypothetical protein